MFDSEELNDGRCASLAVAAPTVTAYDAQLAIVEYFEAVAATPSRYDREKMRALNEVWRRLRELGGRHPELTERIRIAREQIKAERERRQTSASCDI